MECLDLHKWIYLIYYKLNNLKITNFKILILYSLFFVPKIASKFVKTRQFFCV